MIDQIKKAFKTAEDRGWSSVYFFYDIHETILYPDYTNTLPLKFYPYAKEALQHMTKHPMIVNCLYTCSHPDELVKYINFFKEHEIEFKYINENPEIVNTSYGCFDKKPYMSCLFEDKAGFDGERDWIELYHYFNEF